MGNSIKINQKQSVAEKLKKCSIDSKAILDDYRTQQLGLFQDILIHYVQHSGQMNILRNHPRLVELSFPTNFDLVHLKKEHDIETLSEYGSPIQYLDWSRAKIGLGAKLLQIALYVQTETRKRGSCLYNQAMQHAVQDLYRRCRDKFNYKQLEREYAHLGLFEAPVIDFETWKAENQTNNIHLVCLDAWRAFLDNNKQIQTYDCIKIIEKRIKHTSTDGHQKKRMIFLSWK
jgi:hypothetical protein